MKMSGYPRLLAAIVTALLVTFASHASAQSTSTVAGSVRDAQGAAIPGASVTLVSETRGTTFDGVSGDTGDYVFANIPADTYTVKVSLVGFKQAERKGVAVSLGDRAAVPPLTLEVGTLEETVLVTGDAPLIQAQTGDRSFTVNREVVENVPMALRNFSAYAVLTPGVIATNTTGAVARLDGARTNYLLDGISSVNTGGNQQGLQLNSDSIAEVKVVSSAYQAEYGRTTGIQISGVTKSGTNQFRGSVFDIERNSDWNSNSWVNDRNGNAKQVAKQRDWGYTIGGPVGKPGGKNNLFFFYSEQFSPRTTGGAVTRFRVPTALERQGDFSQTVDNNGNVFNFIRDSRTGLPCQAGNTAGCFQDGGVLGRIPQDRLYGLGMNVLKSYPMPNVNIPGANYNLEAVAPDVDSNTFQHVVRVDWQANSKLRLSAKYAGQNATVQTNSGTLPGYNDNVFQFPAILVPSATVDYTLNTSTVLEATWGLTQGNQLGNVINTPYTDPAYTGLTGFPRIYQNGLVPVDSYQEKVLQEMNAPFYQNGRVVLVPSFQWSTAGSRVNNQVTPPGLIYPTFLCMQNTKDLAISITKLWGTHTFKAGYQSQDSLKLQNLGTVTQGALPFEGRVDFTNDTNNPLDTGFPFSNAAIGVFRQFQQQNELYEGDYRYHNKDFYIQDNWKLSPKLTLDVGMRFTHHGPQYDIKQQASNFFPDKWSKGNAPLLYQPGCSVAGATCAAANRVAIDPRTGTSLGPNTAVAIGTIVPGTGVITNGVIQAGKGIAKENYVEDALVFGPRVGAAYDISGNQTMVIRGSVGVFYDRPQGDAIFGQIGNPPTGQGSTVVNSTLQSVAAGTTALQAPPVMLIHEYNAEIGAATQWNAGVQMTLPWYSALDVSYVGTHNYNSIAFGSISTPAGQNPIDLNAPDVGAAYLAVNQDPTAAASTVPGAMALATDLMRPFRGLGPIVLTSPRFHTNYDSLQFAFNRRYRNNWQAGLAWTVGLRFEGNTLSQQQLVHNADGTIGLAANQEANDELISNVGLRRQLIRATFIYDLPNMEAGGSGARKVVAAIANDWQVSGVYSAGSGAPYDATFSYNAAGANVNLTGSPNYTARIRVVGDTGSGCSSNQYAQFSTAAFAGPTYNSIGNESGANLLSGCWDHTTDLSIARNIRLGGAKQVQFRVDAFNLFNTIVYNSRVTQLQYNSPTDQATLRNAQYNADGTLVSTRLTPANAGAGAVNGAQAMRTVQMQLRFMF